MKKRISAESKSIGQILGRYERRPVELPQFQRPYSWDKSKVVAFWDDLSRFRSEYERSPTTASYYLGAIVVINNEEELILLDGQQRLATATILLSVIRDTARSLDQKGSDQARDIQRELIEKSEDAFSLTLGELDEEHFKRTIKSDPPSPHAAKIRSHLIIDNARTELAQKLHNSLHGLSAESKLKKLKLLVDALTKGMTVIEIQVPSEEDAVQIFETLNDRGLRLSVPDLVLNLLMKRASTKEKRNLVRSQWNEIVVAIGRRDIAKFLRHFWVSMYGDVKNQTLFAEIKKKLETENLDSVSFSELCAEECETYVALLDNDIPCADTIKSNLEGLTKYLDVGNCVPLLLAGYKCLNPSDFGKLLRIVLITYVRYQLVCRQDPLVLESAFYRAAREVRSAKQNNQTSAKILVIARDILKEVSVSDAEVKKSARTLELDRSEAQWILTQIANSLQSTTKELKMANCNLEHILPVKPSSEWGDVTDFATLTWNIGNLTILSEKLNRAAQNKNFKTKCENYYSKSEVKMSKDLCKVASWTRAQIETRAGALGAEITKLWPEAQ